MEAAETYLRAAASRGQDRVVALVRALSSALVYPNAGNVETNEKLWDRYAEEWAVDADWVVAMASSSSSAKLEVLGDEWAPQEDTERVVREWIWPHIGPSSQVAEIGSGGGRIARLTADRVASLSLFDVSKRMLDRARVTLGDSVSYHHVDGDADGDGTRFGSSSREYPEWAREAFDFVICFDVMVHMDVHTMYRTLKRIRGMLKRKGRAFVSTSNLAAPGGWDRFVKQKEATVGGFCFVTPETVATLADRSGFAVVERGEHDESNVYYHRDHLLLLEARAA